MTDFPPCPTVQKWALAYIESTVLGIKTSPPKEPLHWEPDAKSIDPRPGRPLELRLTTKKPRSFKEGGLKIPETKAALIHKFWHHELQAAELMCWALVRYPDTPLEFKRGLVRIFRDEVRHMALYESQLQSLGFQVGDFEVRDWFWQRVPTCINPLEFVALLGMGLEAANLEHTSRFAALFRSQGDELGARIQDQVGREEIAHVRFATRWFKKWTGGVDFSLWRESLPPPLTPLLMRGKVLDRDRRMKAEFSTEFVDELAMWQPQPTSNRKR